MSTKANNHDLQMLQNRGKVPVISGKPHRLDGEQIFKENGFNAKDKDEKVKNGKLPEKVFVPRNSLLTDLVEMPYMQTLGTATLAVLIFLVVRAASEDILVKNKLTLGFHNLADGLTNFHMTIFIWICMFLSCVFCYGAFYMWAEFRPKFRQKSAAIKIWDYFWLSLFIAYCCVLPYISVKAVMDWSLRITLTQMVMFEMARMLMKMWAFIRTNATRALNSNSKKDIRCPNFNKFMYFSFAPTLIYRDEYPRTTHIRWKFVLLQFTEFFLAILFMHLVQDYFIMASIEELDLKNITWKSIWAIILKNTVSGFMYWCCMFFIVFHSWQNAFAEMLRFADRQFYKDWWNSTTYAQHYRTWNGIVHDWLYTYIYKDMYEIVVPGNKTIARTIVLLISSLFHELLLFGTYRFLFPILTVLYFVLGLPVSYLKIKNQILANSLFLYTVALGYGILNTCIFMEDYVRRTCPVENPPYLDTFKPRLLFETFCDR